ncbi:hypothetical protein [Eudoraea sp.]|uniref:hypothetical protein n=1 Tax=Eudoraea sp. TaxID=1979955 RepID=UPI003C707088
MKNLENYGVNEMSDSSAKLVHGGSWLGEAAGTFFGALGRYHGNVGAALFVSDYMGYRATQG